MPGALAGIKVVDLSRLLPGPFCSMILADHGAEVIAVEDGTKETGEIFFNGVNRNKRHVSLNLKTEKGREIFFKLVADADVVLEGFRPGVVKRLGVDYEAVSAINPGVVYCSLTGFGQTGPLNGAVGHDVNFMSLAGVLDLLGEAHRPPSIPGIQVGDIMGSMNAALGILLALRARETSGQGQYIDISITDVIAGFLFLPKFFAQLFGYPQTRGNTMLSHRYACYNTYETADGLYLALGAVEAVFWKRLCQVLEAEEYIPLQYDEGRREEITQWLRDVFKSRDMAHWERLLGDKDICCTRVMTMDQALDSELFKAREMVIPCPGTQEATIGIPVKLSKTPGSLRTPPDAFGQSTAAVLGELGYSPEEIQTFKSNKII